MELLQVMSLLYVLLLVALEQVLLVEVILKVVKEVEEVLLSSLSLNLPKNNIDIRSCRQRAPAHRGLRVLVPLPGVSRTSMI